MCDCAGDRTPIHATLLGSRLPPVSLGLWLSQQYMGCGQKNEGTPDTSCTYVCMYVCVCLESLTYLTVYECVHKFLEYFRDNL